LFERQYFKSAPDRIPAGQQLGQVFEAAKYNQTLNRRPAKTLSRSRTTGYRCRKIMEGYTKDAFEEKKQHDSSAFGVLTIK